MGKLKLQSILSLKWLNLKKFIFNLPLRTGVQIYGFISFIFSIVIADVLLTKLIDHHICSGYLIKTSDRSSTLECLSTKHIIVPQACQAFMSALLLCYVKRASIPLCWIGCKFAVGVMEFTYLLEWTREFFIQIFNVHIHLAWFAVTFICVYAYGVLVTISYYAELVGNQASYNMMEHPATEAVETSGIPVPPDLPMDTFATYATVRGGK